MRPIALTDRTAGKTSMKRSVRTYLRTRFKGLEWDRYGPDEAIDPLAGWPDLSACVASYMDLHPEMKQDGRTAGESAEFECSRRFLKSLDRYCTTRSLRLRLLDSLAKCAYRVPCRGLRERPIKERDGLWHFYISASWRVFYRKHGNRIVFEEFGPHKKVPYHRGP
jgi:hypothetical protein